MLFDTDGREIGRKSGYKKAQLEEVEDGGRLDLGSKEVEITGQMEEEEWRRQVREGSRRAEEEKVKEAALRKEERALENEAGKLRGNVVATANAGVGPKPMFKPFKVPARVGGGDVFLAARTVAPGRAMFDPMATDALVMPRPVPGHVHYNCERLVDVVLDPHLAKKLRPHQRQGVIFLYTGVMGFR